MSNIIKLDCLTALRQAEAVASVVMLINSDKEKLEAYYKPERMALEHFRFPEVFFRQTKKAYISFVWPETLEIAKLPAGWKLPTYNQIRVAALSKGIKCDMRFCHKIFASHLRPSRIESEIVDIYFKVGFQEPYLQGIISLRGYPIEIK